MHLQCIQKFHFSVFRMKIDIGAKRKTATGFANAAISPCILHYLDNSIQSNPPTLFSLSVSLSLSLNSPKQSQTSLLLLFAPPFLLQETPAFMRKL